MATPKIKLEFTEHAIKKMALESLFSKTMDGDDYEGYFILDEIGNPIYILESKE